MTDTDPRSAELSVELSAGLLHYRDLGPRDGRPVVLVHGFLFDHGVWGEVPQRLAASGLRVLAPTWPLGAHTEAMRVEADLSPEGVAALIGEFLTMLDLDDVVLVGNDSGGALCQLLVTTDSSRVGALVLTPSDAFEAFPPAAFVPLFLACRRPTVGLAALQAVRLRVARHSVLGFGGLAASTLDPALTARWVRAYLTDPAVRRDVAAFTRGWRRDGLVEVTPRLAAFDRPASVVWGAEDRFFRPALGRRLAETLPDARLVEVEDARTLVSLDRPDVLAREIAALAG